MNEINWNQFMLKNANPQEAFETICRNIFLREYKVGCHDFSANYNQTGLETEPVLFKGKYYGFQCKYSTTGDSNSFYTQVLESLNKAVLAYPNLDTVIIYTNLNIKPNVSAVDKINPKKSNRIKIYELAKKNNINIVWFVKTNFEKALNEAENNDLYRSFFSPEDVRGLLNNVLTHNERTFLSSDQFIDLSLNGIKLSDIKDNIMSKKISVIVGAAGTGKSEILKNLYLQCENKYLLNCNQTPSKIDTPIPIFIRMRECINGDLEGALRNRLNDFDINIASSKNPYIYFFDGLDEIASIDFGAVITCIMRLKNKETTRALVLTSRTNTTNLTNFLRDFEADIYTVDHLSGSNVEEYFKRLNNSDKMKKLQEVKENNSHFFADITDIFSVVLLSENIFQINTTTTKADLIKLNTEKLLERNSKYSLINLPEPKTLSVEKILAQVSLEMQCTGNISVSRLDLQGIIEKLFPNCSYLQVDEIIDYISETFFDYAAIEHSQERYSYRHKRYFEFYLYVAIKDVFYENPAILRELGLLSNKDFIINIFLVQELKNNTLSNNVRQVLALRFLEAYLGEAYLYNVNGSWFMPKELLVCNDDSYLQSQQLREYLCTKHIDDLKEFLKNDPLSLDGFLTGDNYYTFVKQYHKTNGIDIREALNDIYDIQDEWLEKSAKEDFESFLYCKCVINQDSIEEIYSVISATENLYINDLDHYPYGQKGTNIAVAFFELAIEYFGDWLLPIIKDISVQHLEVLSYILLRAQNLRYIIKKEEGLSLLAVEIRNRINAYTSERYGLHTIVLYKVLTGTFIQKSDIQERASKVNTNHYETWRRNFELNNYVGVVLSEEFKPYHHDYKLGIALRQIVNDYYPCKKTDILSVILQEVHKFNLVYKNWFSYHNAIFIGEILAALDIDSVEVKKFIIALRKYGSVVSTFQVLYTVMRRNVELFRIIANPSLIDSEYDKACQELSYYDYNSDLGFMYATMISYFDIVKADALFEKAINNSIFRPIFRKEDMIDYHLPDCLLTAYNSYWFQNEEFEVLIYRLYEILKISKDTLDSGAYGEYFKSLVEQCCPHLLEMFDGLAMESTELDRNMGWESYGSNVPIDNITCENLSEYYTCNVDGINYSSISVWKQLIAFELKTDSELTILYQILESNYFPDSRFAKMSKCFPIITAVLISNAQTKPNAIEFIMKHAGRMGLINLIKAFALIGDDKSGRQYIEQLLKLCEVMVYPSVEHIKKIEMHNNRKNKIIDIVCNSNVIDWDEDSENCIMHYMLDSPISIRWNLDEEQEPFSEEWAIKHPDKKAYRTKYYIYYQEEVVKDFDMVWVDGYRALIPMPDITNKHIDRNSYRFGCLVNYDVENYNRYVIASGLIVD